MQELEFQINAIRINLDGETSIRRDQSGKNKLTGISFS